MRVREDVRTYGARLVLSSQAKQCARRALNSRCLATSNRMHHADVAAGRAKLRLKAIGLGFGQPCPAASICPTPQWEAHALPRWWGRRTGCRLRLLARTTSGRSRPLRRAVCSDGSNKPCHGQAFAQSLLDEPERLAGAPVGHDWRQLIADCCRQLCSSQR